MSRVLELKFKLGRLNWVKILFDIEDKNLMKDYYKYKYFHPSLSNNRCAFFVIKKTFSTSTIDKFKRMLSRGLPGVGMCFLKDELKFGVVL